jgi:quercetin dioxygenase-like cupin family protein
MNIMKMIIKHDEVPLVNMGGGIIRQDFANGKNLNVLHWNIADGGVVANHTHPQEQFGYVIKGGFELTIGDEKVILKQGDAYLVPANVPHGFVAIGETEAIDVFAPVKNEFPWTK